MESPFKRPRLLSSYRTDDNDYSSVSSTTSEEEDEGGGREKEEDDEEKENPELESARAQNDLRLKSIFEGIFEKYGRDFSHVGDEIDLSTGDIVVNNGHLSNMTPDGENDPSSRGDKEEEEEEEHDVGNGMDGPRHDLPPEKDDDNETSSVDSLLGTALSVDKGTTHNNTRKKPKVRFSDPLWQAAESSFESSTSKNITTPISTKPTTTSTIRSASPPGAGSLWSLPKQRRRRRRRRSSSSSTGNGNGNSNSNGTSSGQKRQRRRRGTSSRAIQSWKFAEIPDGSESDDPLQEAPSFASSPGGTEETG